MEKQINNAALGQYKPKNLRKRFLVSEGDLFQLYKEIREVRATEQREAFMADFRKLLREAQQVKLVVEPQNPQSDE